MAVTRPTYATREEVKQAADIKLSARNDLQVDRAIEAASDGIEGLTHRQFFTELGTRYFDWPNFQGTYPWKVYLDAAELADVTTVVPVVTTGGNSPQTIPAANLIWGPWNYAPPYTRFELDRSTSSALGLGSTPQRDTRITGMFGYQDVFTPAGALAANVSDTTSTTVQITNGAAVGVGDVLMVGTERMLVADKAMVSTGQTQLSGLNVSPPSVADVTLGVGSGAAFAPYETLLLDSERVFVVDIAGNNLTVKRAWDGSVLATHTGATIYGLRLLTVVRGALGSTAATHNSGAAIQIAVVPRLVKQLAIAEAVVDVAQQLGAYTTTQGDAPGAITKIGQGLPDLRQRCYVQFGRKARQRTV